MIRFVACAAVGIWLSGPDWYLFDINGPSEIPGFDRGVIGGILDSDISTMNDPVSYPVGCDVIGSIYEWNISDINAQC